METPTMTCQVEERRQDARDKGFNGIDFISVRCSDQQEPSLCVHLFGKGPDKIEIANVRIEGGRRVRDIQVKKVSIEYNSDRELENCLLVKLDKFGDLSNYTLRLVEAKDGKPQEKPLAGFDSRYARADFSFAACCSNDLDCRKENICPPEERIEPEIDYLAKDYASFRQLILDRMALIIPDWKERHIPDLGIALVEVLAYIGDYLSYYQDAVATEAYLDTARQRISVRRHVRLVDYFIHEGSNARAWVCVSVDGSEGLQLDPKKIFFITAPLCLRSSSSILKAEDLKNIPSGQYEVFEPLMEKETMELSNLKDPVSLIPELLSSQDALIRYVYDRLSSNTKRLLSANRGPGKPSEQLTKAVAEDLDRLKTGDIYLYQAHSEIQFYTWGDQECCLPRGATKATLRDEYVSLKDTGATDSTQTPQQQYKSPPSDEKQFACRLRIRVGDIILIEEVKGPQTGSPADADPAHRQAVRLTRVEPGIDHLYDQPIVEIEWAIEDALRFPVCISSSLPSPDCTLLKDISVARGNVILVDHGRTIVPSESLGKVTSKIIEGECVCGRAGDATCRSEGFNPILKEGPLTFSQALVPMAPASDMLRQDPRQALPQIVLTGLAAENSEPVDLEDQKWIWHPKYDLLESHSQDHDFVVEMDNDRRAHLRFGDDELGKMPEANTTFKAIYRIGNGPEGNVGADTISFLVSDSTLSGVTLKPRNPLPAQGGMPEERVADIKLFAPHAFRKDLKRAITSEDYVRIAKYHGGMQNAAAEIRWTGSWYEAQVAIDPLGKEGLDDDLRREMEGFLYRFRRMGQDLAVMPAIYVPLDLTLIVCVLPHYLKGHVEVALLNRFSNRKLPDGKPGFFHPDNLTFGEGIAVSKIVAAAQAVPGVESVSAKLKRLGDNNSLAIDDGILKIGPTEIVQLDNDPSLPENGKLTLILGGRR